jgi:hypothetical protein
MRNEPVIPAIAGTIGLHNAAPPGMHNEVATARLF